MTISGGAGWQPDPFGRHQLRWWDGQNWSDQVADDGATSVDPPGPGGPVGAPPGAPPPSTAGSGGGGGAKAAVIVAIIVVVALIAGAVLFFVLGGDDGDGTGEFTAELDDDSLDFYDVSLSACEAVGARLEPDGFDGTLAIAAESFSEEFFTGDDLDSLESEFDSLYSDDDLVDLAADRGLTVALDKSDSGGEDDEELIVAPAVESTTYTIIVGSADGSGGEYDLEIEKLEAPDDADCDIDDAESAEEFFSDEEDYYSDFFSEYFALGFSEEFSSVGSAVESDPSSTTADCDDLDLLQPGDTVSGSVSGDDDFQVCIEVPDDGSDVSLQLTTGSDADLTLTLYDADGGELDYADAGFSGDDEEIDASALDAGSYLVEVGAFSGGETNPDFDLTYDVS